MLVCVLVIEFDVLFFDELLLVFDVNLCVLVCSELKVLYECLLNLIVVCVMYDCDDVFVLFDCVLLMCDGYIV